MKTARKRILIINNNMHIGGVQKALVGLLDSLKDKYDITLLLFRAQGELMNEIPKQIQIVETKGQYRYLGMSQQECANLIDRCFRAFYATVAKQIGVKWSIKLIDMLSHKDKLGKFDAAISYLHCASQKSFYGGTAEYALGYSDADKKICYVHCDYVNSGMSSEYSNDVYCRFDSIACVSDSVRKQFISVLPQLESRTFSIINPLKVNEVVELSRQNPYKYDQTYLNCLSVARLSDEKGIDRFIRAMKAVNSSSIRYYVVGEGQYRRKIERTICETGLEQQVFLLGEDVNPYKYMINADILVVPSYHEAAPVVFQEALVVGLPVFTTCTLSAAEMISDMYGFIVNNDEESMTDKLREINEHREMIQHAKQCLTEYHYDLSKFAYTFSKMIEEQEEN